jgi:hypothetical protein
MINAKPSISQWPSLVVIAVIFVTDLASYAMLDNALGVLATAQINSQARSLMETM